MAYIKYVEIACVDCNAEMEEFAEYTEYSEYQCSWCGQIVHIRVHLEIVDVPPPHPYKGEEDHG